MNTLQKKVGPLPVWGWAAAIALGAVIYYWQRNSAGGQVVAGNTVANPQLDPTEGAFDFPSGISSGGAGPQTEGSSLNANDIADAVSATLIPAIASIPIAAVPGESSTGPSGQNVSDFLANLQTFKDLGFIQSAPAPSTGEQTSKAQPHTTPKHVSERVNRNPHNPRKGQTYRVLVNPHGHPKGTYHVYGTGKGSKFIRVKK